MNAHLEDKRENVYDFLDETNADNETAGGAVRDTERHKVALV